MIELNSISTPEWFEYPLIFRKLVESNLIQIEPWRILLGEQIVNTFKGLRTRYSGRFLFPFARRIDNDDVACWNREMKIVIIQDFASEGWEGGREDMEFSDWLKLAIDDFIDFHTEYI